MISTELQQILDEKRRGVVVPQTRRVATGMSPIMEQFMSRPCAPDPVYECERCQDTGCRPGRTHGYFECECRVRKVAKAIMVINDIDPKEVKRLNDFRCKNALQRKAVSAAIEFIRSFYSVDRPSNGLFFGGKPGSGKSHLTKAVAVALIEMRRPVIVDTMNYIQAMKELKHLEYSDTEKYERLQHRHKNAELLWIEDAFKDMAGATLPLSSPDKRQLEPIIYPRYEKQIKRPILISSELTIGEIYAIDEGIGRRIKEMCHPNIFEFIGEEYVYDIIGEKEKQKAREAERRQTQGHVAGLG